ncbi:MAG: AAA family ATPase [Gemmatimonadota bacterium]
MDADELATLVRTIRSLPPRAGSTAVVLIDGPSGSGKSTFAERLAVASGAAVLAVEDMYPGWDGLEAAAQRVVEDVLEPLARGEEATIRRWDWDRSVESGREPVPAAAILIIEGVGAGSVAAGAYAGLLVWLEADDEERYARAMQRDGELFAPHWERWAEQERRFYAREDTRARADLRLRTDEPGWDGAPA